MERVGGARAKKAINHQQRQKTAQIISELRLEHALPDLLTIAELSRSTYYYHQQRLMQLLRLKAVIRAPKKYRSYRGKEGRIAPNILMRKFDCEEPNHKWVTDVTEFRVGDEKLYLSPVLDLFNRQIIAYQLMRKPVYKLVSDRLEKAISTLKSTEKPLIHSDQGWQYQLDSYQQTLASHGFTQSMSRKGNCLDNAVIESFFGTLKCELFYREKFTSIEQLEKRIHEYIYYYNHERVSTKLKGLSPVQYRNQSSL